MIVGIVLGYWHTGMGQMELSIQMWCDLNPDLIKLLFLPPLVFEAAFRVDMHLFVSEVWKILLFAGPCVVINTGAIAAVYTWVLGYDTDLGFNFTTALLFGTIASTTNPAFTVEILKELGVSKRPRTLIEGESLLGNGTAMIIFLVLLDLVGGQELIWADLIRQLLQLIIGGIILGLFTGFILQMILSRLPINATIEVNTTIFATYLIFYTAEEILQASGILAVITMGLYLNAFSKNSISPESEETLH